MPLSPEQLQKEKEQEALINKISEAIIKQTPFGAYYQYMKAASQMGQGFLPHKFCTDKDGRTIKVYKGDFSKVAGSFIKPVHEQAARDISQKKYARAIVDLIGFGSFWDLHEQKQGESRCIVFKPEEILNLVKQNVKQNLDNGKIKLSTKPPIKKPNYTVIATIIGLGILTLHNK